MAPREDEDEKVCRLSLRETQLQVVNIGAKVVNIGAKVDLLSAQLADVLVAEESRVKAKEAKEKARGAMLSKLSGDEQCIIFSQLCNVLDPGVAMAFGSASSERG